MKKTILTLLAIAVGVSGYAQIDVIGKVKDATINRADERTDEGIDEGLNKTEEGIKSLFKKKKKPEKTTDEADKKPDEANTNSSKNSSITSTPKQEDLKSYSKFDFVSGDKVIYFEDFSQGAVGDFPAKWNTNASGEIVTIGSGTAKWLKIINDGQYKPEIKTTGFPDNYTIEFDLIFKSPTSFDMGNDQQIVRIDIYNSPSEKILQADGNNGGSGIGSRFGMQAGGFYEALNWKDNSPEMNNTQNKKIFTNNKITHISIWIQKQRGRLYVDETKVFDLPFFIPPAANCNAISFLNAYLQGENDEILLSNIRIAIGAPDMRSKLMTDGKLVTRGITFDVNSDKIKSESYGTLKEISKVLTENPTVKVKIVGHTDSDGADAANLELSKKRAVAIKNSLTKDFSIDASRMETDGRGESEPSSPNTTSEGKANNRRVEFIKL